MGRKTRKQLIEELLRPLCDADGDPYPSEAFENDLTNFPEISEKKAKEAVERLDRLLAGDNTALDGWRFRD